MIRTHMTTETSPYREEPSYGTGAVIDDSRSFRVRTRGAKGEGTIEHDYECPVHGRFAARVARPAPDEVVCPTRDSEWCGRTAPWRASLFAAGNSAGSVRG